MKIDDLSDLLVLQEIIEESGFFKDVNYSSGTIEILMTEKVEIISNKLDEVAIPYTTLSSKSIGVQVDRNELHFFKDSKAFYDRVCLNGLSLAGKSIFIWAWNNSSLLYENFSIEDTLANKTKAGDFIANVVQYRDVLTLFLDVDNDLIELDRPIPQNELFITSKGDEKLLVKLTYQKIVERLYSNKFEFIDQENFSKRIKNEEWLACFKNTVCAFFDQQSEAKRTFLWLYENFAYLFANTEKSYFLYISKFSFDKISRQFKKDREHYFNNLSEYQNKLSGQLISIPLTIGAALLSNNFVTNNGLASNSVIFLISAYIVFVMGTIGFVLVDLIKLKNDIRVENDALKNMYTEIHDNFKGDFTYILRKSRFLIGFAWFLLSLFVIVLIVIWFAPISVPPSEVILAQ
ncbi:hypothetical protein FXV77_21105 [Sphingobacterium phlebotomi]|uniref:Uncharacterized protein n=1 Tax=Sphingobacterium phlebotomi TaxID=2605433 RepID=A0A5D4GR03_9SPHI|nr:hypothetical protein [Sphingobacterium phlebotomi]TYR31251.1 hypothetical protein FXV77_21105 [Sphingobacterium phlebotomi]